MDGNQNGPDPGQIIKWIGILLVLAVVVGVIWNMFSGAINAWPVWDQKLSEAKVADLFKVSLILLIVKSIIEK